LERLGFAELEFEVHELQPTKNCRIKVYGIGCYPQLACLTSFCHQEVLGFVKKINRIARDRERCSNTFL
jgi:hypothetical protein